MPEISIRLAGPADAQLIALISRETFNDSFASQNTKENMDKFMNETFTHEALVKEVGSPGNIFLLAHDGDTAAGYVRLRESLNPSELGKTPSIEIARIYTATAMTSRGIGSKLMQYCLGVAREMNKKVIWLGVWEHNLRAIEFYKRWGFQQFSNHVFILGDDVQNDWLMKRDL